MSDDWLHIVPMKPDYVPSEDQVRNAASVLASAWADVHPRVLTGIEEDRPTRGDEIVIQAVLRKDVGFIGGPFETIRCPHCGRDLDFDWWDVAVNQAFEKKFHDLTVKTPCCAQETTLNEFDYGGGVGFSRFSITVMNPFREVERRTGPVPGPGYWVRLEPLPLGPDVLSRIGAALGCPVRTVRVHL